MPQQIIVGDRDSCRCDPPPAANIPGVPGEPGTSGAAGAPGSNAWASLTSDFTMPLQSGTGVAELDHTDWLTPGEPLFVEFLGTLLVVSIAGLNVTLQNLQDGAGAYPQNAAPGTIAPTTVRVTPTGFEGAAGSIGGGAAGGALTGTYPNPQLANVGTPQTVGDSTHVARVTTNAAGQVSAMTSVAIAFPAASIPSGVLNAQYAPNDGNLIAGEVLFATAIGQETKTAANAKLALGLNGMVGNYVLCQDRHASGVASGNFPSGSRIVVPLNTKVSDVAGIIALAGNVMAIPTGNYRVRATILGYLVDNFQGYLFNISDAATEIVGTSAAANSIDNGSGVSFVNGRLIVTGGPKNYRLEAQCTTSNVTNGFGLATGIAATTEVYASIELEQEA